MRLLTCLLLAAAICPVIAAPLSADSAPNSSQSPISDFRWMRGANYVPSYARNDVQTWIDYDPQVVDRELGFAEKLKLNVVRVFLQVAVYERDPERFLANFESFLSLCQKHHIQMMPVVFDSCFGEFPDLEGYREKDWMACPGQNRLGPEHWPAMEKFVRDVVGSHRDDERIVLWDVMNEPYVTSFNSEADRKTIHTFLGQALEMVRRQQPKQPLAVGWEAYSLAVNPEQYADKVDVLAFHNYEPAMQLRQAIRRAQEGAQKLGKPVILNEVVGRPRQPFADVMQIVREQQIGWCFWELMLGKTQFSREDPPYQGLIYPDGTCYDAQEVACVMDVSVEEASALFPQRRWSPQQAWDWYQSQPWLVGFNYVPSTACNTTEWWQAETFDPVTIDRELGWAEALGFNTTRCFIQYLVWKQDAAGFKKRLDQFLAIAHQHGITVMPVLFDDCAFGEPTQMDPYLGKQREPIPGMILPSWTPSPGRRLGFTDEERPLLEQYVRDVIGTFRDDARIIAWDLYNEPMNVAQVGTPAVLHDLFSWAQAAKPSQPLTVGIWNGDAALNQALVRRSDLISFHHYGPLDAVKSMITDVKQHGRPVICTEWMARPRGSRIESDLPMFKTEAVGCYMWGFVNGRTQAQFPWWNKPHDPVHEAGWFHDILHTDGQPYRPDDIEVIRRLASKTSRMDGKRMMFADTARGQPFAKDPDVVRFADCYWMYYSMRPDSVGRFAIGIARSQDLTNWQKVGEILPTEPYEIKGLVAGAAIVLRGKVHLFYSTYGNGKDDAICHAWSDDGLHFHRDTTNPIFRPTGDWNSGRAIDADVIEHAGKLLLYCATRDPAQKIQMLVGAEAPLDSDFGRDAWTQFPGGPVLKPELSWEKDCVEAPSVCEHNDQLYMFYAGAYNNQPQQIGVATSRDGRRWQRMSQQPLLPCGEPGAWNSSESGHPGVFVDDDRQMQLFFQGNADNGATWYLSKMSVAWNEERPYLIDYCAGRQFWLRPPGEVRDTDGELRYSDGWTLWRGDGPLYGTLHFANQADCTATLRFRGTQLSLIHKVGPDCGIAEIVIDGQPGPLTHLDTYSAEVDWHRITILARDLTPDEHVITVRVLGKRCAESSNTYVQIIGFHSL